MNTEIGKTRVDLVRINNQQALFVLRDDLIHPHISGNKWRKLKYNLQAIQSSGENVIITFGGAFSNHLVATAAAGKLAGIKCIGIVRGDEVENERIRFMKENGMLLHFVSRTDYRHKTESIFLENLKNTLLEKKLLQENDRLVYIPEGGSNELAVKGTEEINQDIPENIETIFCATGSGGTVAGISRTLKSHQRIKAVPVLKGAVFLEEEIEKLGGDLSKIDFLYDYHFGGYAKTTDELNLFCKNFSNETSIPIEPVYTGKVFYACMDYLKNNPHEKICVIHTGGVF